MKPALVFILSLPVAAAFTAPLVKPTFRSKPQIVLASPVKKSQFHVDSSTNQLFATVSDDAAFKDVSGSADDLLPTDELKENLLGTAKKYSDLTIGVMKETYPGENRVSQSPETVAQLVKAGFDVVVESGGKIRSISSTILLLYMDFSQNWFSYCKLVTLSSW